MRKCPNCGAPYDVTDAICPQCGAELPAPYEGWSEEEDDGYDTGEFPNPVPAEGTSEVRTIFADGSVMQLAGQYTFQPSQLTILSGAEIFLPDTLVNPGTIVMAQGRILAIYDHAVPDPQDGATYIDLTGRLLAPGFIDLHVHGMMGIDTNEATVEDFQRLSTEAAARGVTALLPTTVACPTGTLSQVLVNFRAAREQGTAGARLLGLHLESNFISPQYKGAQPAEHIISPDDPQAWPIRELIDQYADDIAIVTLAPEIPGALEMIPWLIERNIIVSLGHSAASYEQAITAIEAGATHVTHLFNAMSPLHHRAPGLVGAALERDELFVEAVCDGMHVHPAVLTTIITAKSAERVMAVSDGLQGAGMQTGSFTLAGRRVTVEEGIARLTDGTIAGSTATMDSIVRTLVGQVGWDLAEVFIMTSTTPADALNIPRIGRIAVDCAADLVVLDDELNVVQTFVNGSVVYQR